MLCLMVLLIEPTFSVPDKGSDAELQAQPNSSHFRSLF